ncbi:40216_t:CDS:2, partial [Gigaspora margarita]
RVGRAPPKDPYEAPRERPNLTLLLLHVERLQEGCHRDNSKETFHNLQLFGTSWLWKVKHIKADE